ncbi:F5/8 type C domain-containing protein [Nonomuraea solani]|uniref:F5/8 type C domain-containing protein n=1 Tax=Nonomuraea solani TaxID=1144553 RepID=A0A1H6EH34_9ACTN|nr:exo-alpha-sialidase [Nonomuraea solani]SEG97168.1 F5/8 type C domain-containing protein [Nonomuraea solani]
MVHRAVVAAMSVAAGLPAQAGPAQAGAGYCVLPDHSQQSAPSGAYLIDTASSLDWIHPNPPPAAPEPTESERLDFAGFPNVSALDTIGRDGAPAQKVITTYTTNVDKVVTLTNAASVSADGGLTFGPSSQTPLRESPIELHDGRYFATEYYLARTDPHTARLGVLTSSSLDDEEGWVRSEATLSTPGDLLHGGAAHGAPVQLADGTILITAYARYGHTGTYQAEVYASGDGGRTFARRGVIAEPSAEFVYNEAALEQTLDGSLLAVLRRDGGPYSTLHQSRSTDGGRTWSPVREVRFTGQDCVVRGVAPRLLLTPGGVLVLSAGRPDNWMAVSPDGLGEEWLEPRVTYHNRDGIWDTHGSSGYTGLAAVGAHRLIQVFDNCKLPGVNPDGLLNETTCPAHGLFEYGGWYAVKRLLFTVATPGGGRRLDLAALRHSGRLRIETTMRWSSPYRPRARPSGAIDGSTGYWSSAVAAGRGRYVLHLGRRHHLSRIGLSLRPGHPAGARVYVSDDGRSWGEPVVTITGRTDHALRYDEIGRAARHVKIVVEPTSGCDPEIGRECGILNEVELYS